ncbi:MAG: hypothetical protein LBH69_02545 [Methanomassiliicoccaceae archaeon]|jgi:hypothetical protein|nr:hypothetical protein [Methanomassiliicoccaceae archaeon]
MNVKIIAIIVAAIVCGGAAVAYFATKDNGGAESHDYGPTEIIDGSGTKITLSEPLTGVITVNTNVPKAMKVLGLTDELKGLCFYSSSSALDDENYATYKVLFPNSIHMPEARTLTAEAVIDISGCKYIIAPVSSMTLSPTQEAQCKQLGITVIRLDCFGDTALEDLEKLTILFGGERNPKMMAAYNSYLNMYNNVVNTVKAAVAADGKVDATFLYFTGTAAGGGTFYNQTAGGSLMIEQIYGKNALRNMGLSSANLVGPTNPSGADGIREVVMKEDQDNGISKVFIRGSSSTSAGAGSAMARGALGIWENSNLPGYNLTAVSENEVYVFNTNIMSGMLSFAAWVAVAEMCGVDTGLHIADLITAYNETYGFSEPTAGFVFQMVGGDTGAISFKEITV